MTASVVLANLAYLVGAVVLAVILGVAVAFRHRRPKSLEANVESFNKGLQALSPGSVPGKRRRPRQAPPVAPPTPAVQRTRTAVPLGRDVPAGPTGPAAPDDREASTG